MFARLATRCTRGILKANRAPRRTMGGVSQGPKEPYEPFHEPSIYGNTPLPFGVGPNYKMEGWELPVLVTFSTMIGLFIYGEMRTDNEAPIVSLSMTIDRYPLYCLFVSCRYL